MANEIHVGDTSTKFKVTLVDGDDPVDISAATVSFLFLKPSGEVLEKDGVFETDGEDGVFYCLTEEGDIDEVGVWKGQISIDYGTSQWSSDIESFLVFPNLQ